MKNWTIARRVIFGFLTVILLTVGLATVSLRETGEIQKVTEYMRNDPYPGLNAIFGIEGALKTTVQITAWHVLAKPEKKERLSEELASGKRKVDSQLEAYDRTITDPADRKMFDELKQLWASTSPIKDRVLSLSTAGKQEEAMAILDDEFMPLEQKALALVTTLVEFNQKNATAALESIEKQTGHARSAVVIGSSVSILAAILVSFVINRSVRSALTRIATSLREGADQVASASGEVSGASQSLAEGASEQAASLEETSASLEEMSAMTKRNAENAQQSKKISSEARVVAESGAARMTEMAHAMDAIKSSSDGIAKIIKTIDEIAFQTNILALNAAVEAARAGEAGMGFAVVAEEVRNLAQRSAESARETAAKIEDAMTKSEQGVAITQGVARSLSEILEKVREVDPLVAEIAQASSEQSTGITQLNTAMGQMDRVTQQNASSAEETAASAQELSAQAALLLQATDELQALVVGRSAPARKAAPVAETAPVANQRTKSSNTNIQRVARPRPASPRPRLSVPAAEVPQSITAGSPRLSFANDAHFES